MTSQDIPRPRNPTPTPEQAANAERVRGYLLSQSEKYDLLDLWPRVVADRLAFLQSLEGVTEEQARWRPPSGEGEDAWGILEVAQHLLGWTDNVIEIVEATAYGRAVPKRPPGAIDADPSATLADVRKRLIAASARLTSMPGRIGPDADGAATVDHAFFGPLNYRAWFLFARLHDTDHVNQVQRLKEMEGFPS